MIDDGIYVEQLVEKIKPNLIEFSEKFKSEIFTEEVLISANQDLKQTFDFITGFIDDFEKPKKPFSLDLLFPGVDIGQYSRTTPENFGFIH